MPHFHYQALNADLQPVADDIQAESVSQAIAHLEARGLTVQSISQARPESAASSTATPSATLTIEQAALRSHMATVLERGKEIAPALRAYAEEMPAGQRRRQLETVLRVIDRGDSTEAISALQVLPEYWISLLSAASSSRDPGRVLREFLEESERAAELRRQWWLTLAYPLIVVGLAVALLVVLSFVVIPVFRDIMYDFGLELPLLTRLVFAIAAWISSGLIFIVAAAVIGFAMLLFKALRWLPLSVRTWFGDRFGTLLGRSTAIARFGRFTADLLEAGLEIPNALRIAGFTTNGSRLQRAAWRLANEIESGSPFGQSAQRHPLTATVLYALRSEMPTTARVRLLREVSSCYAERARRRLSWTHGIIEPIAICVIGLIVGGTVIAFFLPLFSLIHGLS